MKRTIPVISSIGTGQTELSAYDDALWKAGIGNCNLIPLSSVIPPAWAPRSNARLDFIPRWGNRLYVVQAMCTAGDNARIGLAAGIGWAIFDHGGGVFVEHHAVSSDADHALRDIERQIALSIDDLCHRRDALPVIQGKMTTSTTAHVPSCALVVAVFKEEDW
ncbi:pyruvoyl-dependent arginine decarboxylase [Collimonas sp. H4R21]|uniref:Pyruvoyl-dependent arginine decarboxylase AaxB n=1 Tax=Collimonas rhizosphaerae TaxID=3126357 RepID=A0ABU9Q3H0_9BURK